jgi:RNA polymerase sigma factor (sigma-70 family)
VICAASATRTGSTRLHRLLVRACHRQLRAERGRWATELELDPATAAGALSDRTDAIANRDEIERVFRRLTGEQRTILTLVYFADLTLPDVADVLGIPLGTAKSRLHRSMAAVRAALAADRRSLPLPEGQIA